MTRFWVCPNSYLRLKIVEMLGRLVYFANVCTSWKKSMFILCFIVTSNGVVKFYFCVNCVEHFCLSPSATHCIMVTICQIIFFVNILFLRLNKTHFILCLSFFVKIRFYNGNACEWFANAVMIWVTNYLVWYSNAPKSLLFRSE